MEPVGREEADGGEDAGEDQQQGGQLEDPGVVRPVAYHLGLAFSL